MHGNKNLKTCPCCGLPTEFTIPFNPCEDAGELEPLGSGFVLYYTLKKYTIVILAVMSLIMTVYALSTNFNAGLGEEWQVDDDSSVSFVVRSSVGNHGRAPENYESGSVRNVVILNIIVMIVVLGISVHQRRRLLEIDGTIDQKNLTPSDFALYVKNIPQGK